MEQLAKTGKAAVNRQSGQFIPAIKYRMTKGRERVRSWRESPLYQRILPMYHSTRVGRFSKYIADTAHYKNYIFWEWIAYKSRLWHVQRKISLFTVIVGSFLFGIIHSGKGRNYYTKGAHQGAMQISDFSLTVM